MGLRTFVRMKRTIRDNVPTIGEVIATVVEVKLASGHTSRTVLSAVYASTGRQIVGAPLKWVQEYLAQ